MHLHQAETVNSGSAEPDRVNTREGNKSNHSALVCHPRFGEKLAAMSFYYSSELLTSNFLSINPLHTKL